MESGKVYVRNYVREGGEKDSPVDPFSSEHSKENHVPNTMQQDKTTMSETSRYRRDKQPNLEIIVAKFVPVDTLIKQSPYSKQSKKRKGSRVSEIPSKPNRRTKLINQLRLNSKALWNPSLKDRQPIVIEDRDTEEDICGFSNMEEMVIHTWKRWQEIKQRRNTIKGRP